MDKRGNCARGQKGPQQKNLITVSVLSNLKIKLTHRQGRLHVVTRMIEVGSVLL